uniref:Uncharacterized protein n=1 Tax=Lepeophtheirus salmonis TaxID=72036 RepID=A0A0K2U9Z6_LEPSM
MTQNILYVFLYMTSVTTSSINLMMVPREGIGLPVYSP